MGLASTRTCRELEYFGWIEWVREAYRRAGGHRHLRRDGRSRERGVDVGRLWCGHSGPSDSENGRANGYAKH
jgi:hypothetical protein